jgi:hypothetical protein
MELNEFASFQTLKEGNLQQRNKLMELELALSSIPPFFLFFFPFFFPFFCLGGSQCREVMCV